MWWLPAVILALGGLKVVGIPSSRQAWAIQQDLILKAKQIAHTCMSTHTKDMELSRSVVTLILDLTGNSPGV